MVIKKLWRKGDETSRRINLLFYYHPECYMVEGLEYLQMNPYTPGLHKRGPKTTLTPDQQRQRKLILMRRASLIQRKKKLKVKYPDRLLFEAKIDQQLIDLMVEIAPLGGIPISWLTTQPSTTSEVGQQ